jgi:hypothetical protein
MKRPIIKWTQLRMDVIWMMLPMIKTTTPRDKLFRRPSQSDVLSLVSIRFLLVPSFSCRQQIKNLLGSAEGSNETPNTHQGDEQGLDDGSPRLRAVWLGLGEPVDEVPKEQHARNLTGIVAEEEATDRGGQAEDNRLNTAVGAIDADRPAGEDRLVSFHDHFEQA